MKNKILFVVSILFGLMFLNAGLNKFLHYIPVPDDMPEASAKMMNAMLEMIWLMPLLAVVEIIGGILFMIPKFRPLAAIIIFPVMVGIVITHMVSMPEGLPIALVMAGINIWVIIENRDRYLHMIA